MTVASRDDERKRARLESLVREHLPFVCRNVRRLGVHPADLDDVVQEVFLVVGRHLDDLEPGRERGYMFRTCMYLVGHARRTAKRRREIADDEHVGNVADEAASPEHDAALSEARRRLQEVLDGMPEEFRSVFVLFELERLTAPEIADTLGIPPGTVASRLRRARELFVSGVARGRLKGGSR